MLLKTTAEPSELFTPVSECESFRKRCRKAVKSDLFVRVQLELLFNEFRPTSMQMRRCAVVVFGDLRVPALLTTPESAEQPRETSDFRTDPHCCFFEWKSVEVVQLGSRIDDARVAESTGLSDRIGAAYIHCRGIYESRGNRGLL